MLTGESLPVTKKKGDQVFSGSTCKQGEIEAVVIATGASTFFGKTALLVDSTDVTGHFQQVYLLSIFVGLVNLESGETECIRKAVKYSLQLARTT